VASDESLGNIFATAALAASPFASRRAELTPLQGTELFEAQSSAEPICCRDNRLKLSACMSHWTNGNRVHFGY